MPPPDGLVAGAGRAARRGSMRAASAAIVLGARAARSTGTSRNAGSVRNASRSAIASLDASMPRWIQAGSVTPVGPKALGVRRLEPVEDRQDLEGDEPGAVGRVGGDADAAVVGRDRVAPGARVRPQVGRDDRAAGRRQAASLPLPEVAVVERVGAVRGQGLERRRERRQPDPLTGPPGPAVRAVDGVEPGVGADVAGDDARPSPRPRR